MNIVLMVVPEPDPDTETILESGSDKPHPFLRGEGDVNLLCGECGFHVAENLRSADQAVSMVLRCSRCGAYNATRV